MFSTENVEGGLRRLRHSLGSGSGAGGATGIFRNDIVVKQFLKLRGELVVGALERGEFLAINIYGAAGLFPRSRHGDADIRGFRFARAIDDAAHHGELQFLDAFELSLPLRHFVANILLDALGKLLKCGARRAAAARAGGDARGERAQAEGLEKFARGIDFLAAIASGAGSERDANRVADTLAEQDAHRGGGPDEALGAHAGLSQSEMQRLICLRGEFAIDAKEIARTRDFAGDDDLVLAEAAGEGELCGLQSREDHAFVNDVFRSAAEVAVSVLLHLLHDELLIERAAVHADAHGLAVVDGDFADGGELFVAAHALADVAGIDAVFVEGPGTFGIFREKDMAVVMEIADEGRVAAGIEDALLDFGHGGGGFRDVDGDADNFGAGLGKFEILPRSALCVGCVGVRHGLDDDGRAAADLDFADLDADSFMPLRDS